MDQPGKVDWDQHLKDFFLELQGIAYNLGQICIFYICIYIIITYTYYIYVSYLFTQKALVVLLLLFYLMIYVGTLPVSTYV